MRVVRRDRYMFLRVEHLGKLLGIKLRGESSLLYHPDEFKSGVNLWEGSGWIAVSGWYTILRVALVKIGWRRRR